MHRRLRQLAFWLTVGLALLLYREWVVRHKPALYIPLGFVESAINVMVPEDEARLPENWKDPLENRVMDGASYDARAMASNATKRAVDILVTGATFGGIGAAVSAADDGATVMLSNPSDLLHDLRTEAGQYAAQELLPHVSNSMLEHELRAWPPIAEIEADPITTANALPADVVAFFTDRVSRTPSLELAIGYDVVAIGIGSDGKPDRALLQSMHGSGAIDVRFSYLIDGTKEGSTLALAGVRTRIGWDTREETGELRALPSAAATALAEGYTMSGRTIPGIGRRLDGARMSMGILDRGYHGRFIAPSSFDTCWKQDNLKSKQSFIWKQPVLRTNSVGCTANFFVPSTFTDTVEVFFVNHGNDTVMADVRFGSGAAINIETRADPKSPFILLGRFPVSRESPLAISVHSALPTDRLEGIVVRKMNVGESSEWVTIRGAESTVFATAGWNVANHDVYVSSDSIFGVTHALIDDKPYELERVGSGTFVARDIVLNQGNHSIRISDGQGILEATVVQTNPYREDIQVLPKVTATGSNSWTLVPERDGTAVFALPTGACETECTIFMNESGANALATMSVHSADSLARRLSVLTPVNVVELRRGIPYDVTVNGAYDASRPPVSFMLGEGTDLYEAGGATATVRAAKSGGMYDVWARTQRSSTVTVSIGDETRKLPSPDGWTYVDTTPMPSAGVTASANGGVEILALPNTNIDTYVLSMYPNTQNVVADDLPPGIYMLHSFGLENASRLMIGPMGSMEQYDFIGKDGTYASDRALAHGLEPIAFSLTNTWPQRLQLYEAIKNQQSAQSWDDDNGEAFRLQRGPAAGGENAYVGYGPISAGSIGILLFNPWMHGIGPMTIGTLGSPSTEARLREIMNDAFLLLRNGRSDTLHLEPSCTPEADPTCDLRRYVRAPTVFGTKDSVSPTLYHAEGRRLVGFDTLYAGDAFAFRSQCIGCASECIDGSVRNSQCRLASSGSIIKSDSILSISGISTSASVQSPQEKVFGTIPALFKLMRKDRLLGSQKTYLEETQPARDVSLTLGMLVSADADNVLAANTTVSATHQASRALRTPTTELAIGSVAGHVAAYALKREHTTIPFILGSMDATTRLQRYLIDKEITVFPLSNEANDPLLKKSIELRMLEGRAETNEAWEKERLRIKVHPVRDEDATVLSTLVFGKELGTVREALKQLPNAPAEATDLNLTKFGAENGMLWEKTLRLNIVDLLDVALDESFLLKAEYLLRTSKKE